MPIVQVHSLSGDALSKLRETLAPFGFSVETSPSISPVSLKSVDLVFVDCLTIDKPFDTIRVLHSIMDFHGEPIPIIALGGSLAIDEPLCLRQGASAFVLHPWLSTDILDAVRDVLKPDVWTRAEAETLSFSIKDAAQSARRKI